MSEPQSPKYDQTFIDAIKDSDLDTFRELLDKNILDGNLHEKYFILACEKNNYHIIEDLYNSGFKVTKKAFHALIKNADQKDDVDCLNISDTVMRFIKDYGYVPDKEDILLILKNNIRIECHIDIPVDFDDNYFKTCMQKGIYPFRAKYPIDCLRHECERGKLDNVRTLIQYGVNPDQECLSLACKTNIKVVKLLAKYGLEVKVENTFI